MLLCFLPELSPRARALTALQVKRAVYICLRWTWKVIEVWLLKS
jgi:hypothetical protein